MPDAFRSQSYGTNANVFLTESLLCQDKDTFSPIARQPLLLASKKTTEPICRQHTEPAATGRRKPSRSAAQRVL